MGELTAHPLSELCSFINRGASPTYTEHGGILVLNQKCVRDQRVIFDRARRTDILRKPVSAERILKPFDILVNSTGVGTLGRVAQVLNVQEQATVDSHLTIVRADQNKVHPRYLSYALRWRQSDIEALAEGSTGQTELSRTRLGQLALLIPHYEEQIRIAELLGAIDDKIDINQQMNEMLEAMARLFFKDWFVDFGPTRAKAEGLPPYLASDIWSLFPDALDEDDKPVGWRIGQLQEITEFNPSESLLKGKVAPYLEMAAIPTSGSISENPVAREFSSGTKFRNGDTLLARITPCLENGKTAFVQSLPTNEVGWGSTEFIVMRPISPVPKPYAYILAREPGFRSHAIQSMTGTSGRQRVRTEALKQYAVAIANSSVWRAFGSLIEGLFEQIKANSEESKTLAQTSGLLLPKLMSGEIGFHEAKRAVEETSL